MAEHHPGDHATVSRAHDAAGHAHGAMKEHAHGTMDISEHEKTFEGFIRFWVYLFGASAVILIFLAIFAA